MASFLPSTGVVRGRCFRAAVGIRGRRYVVRFSSGQPWKCFAPVLRRLVSVPCRFVLFAVFPSILRRDFCPVSCVVKVSVPFFISCRGESSVAFDPRSRRPYCCAAAASGSSSTQLATTFTFFGLLSGRRKTRVCVFICCFGCGVLSEMRVLLLLVA